MKRIIYSLLASALILSAMLFVGGCKNDKKEDPTPRSEVPDEIARKWLYGGFSMGEFWDYDGNYQGNAFEAGNAFDFKQNGEFEFYLVAGGTTYGCHTEAFTYKKGTVQFDTDNHTFTIYPTEGNARGFYRGCASSLKDYNNTLTRDELPAETFYYSLEEGSNGKPVLVVRHKPEEGGTTFMAKSW